MIAIELASQAHCTYQSTERQLIRVESMDSFDAKSFKYRIECHPVIDRLSDAMHVLMWVYRGRIDVKRRDCSAPGGILLHQPKL